MILYNSLSRTREEFVPREAGKVSMYTCGPTVYHFAHIGNLRTYMMEDILDRYLRYSGYEVKRVMNITDVGHLTSDGDTGEDKMLKGAKRENKSVMDIARFYTEAFFAECYGVMCSTQCKAEKVVIRAYTPYTNYLRTLPLHHSQKELQSTPEYADFEFYLHPTFDFLQELFSQINELEVLEPAHLRQTMKEHLMKALERYE